MIKDIRLFLRGMEADLPQAPDILFNYTEDDLRNPTIVKNSYTKTLTLDNTPANNKIFSEFVNNQFVVGSGFNPTKKMPFLLYLDGDLVESGYARLDSITGTENYKKYQITMFGGLGDFFYNLMYNDDEGGKRTMADLHYIPVSASTSELNFTINKETISSAWAELTHGESGLYDRRWRVINFMPAYEGIPDDFDADKVLINFRDSALVSGVTSGAGETISAYTAFDGYALAEMKHEHTGDEMHEFRSYLQRPVLNVKKAIEAICDSENNGGYSVELDSHFFNSDNPYWTDTWVTLPLLKSFEMAGENPGEVTTSMGSVTKGGVQKPDRYYWEERPFTISGTGYNSDNMYSIQASFTLQWNNVKQAYANRNPVSALTFNLYTDNDNWYRSCMIAQLVAYNSNGQAVAGGKAVNLTSVFPYDNTYPTPNDFGQTLPWGSEFENSVGKWDIITSGGNNVKWNQPLNLSIDYVPYGSTVKLVLRKYTAIGPDMISGPAGAKYNICLCGLRADTTAYTNDMCYYSWNADAMVVENTSCTVQAMNTDKVRSGSHFNKNLLLSTDYSPADFLLSYCKMFGLYFSKDRYEKKIYIRDRNTYYNDDIVSATEIIDRAKMDIKPVFMGTKWIDFDAEAADSEAITKYKEQFGLDYGIQRVNTGYEFNADINSLLQDSIFKGGVTVLEKSEGFSHLDDDSCKPWMLEGYSYNLYLSGNTSNSTAVTYQEESTIDKLQGWRKDYKYYDYFEKMQFHDEDNSPVDGSGVLVFYNGNHKPDRTVAKYWITDDVADMLLLNDGKPCWLWSMSKWDASGSKSVALPVGDAGYPGIPLFSRYKYFDGGGKDGGIIRKSLDFGTPKQLFNPLSKIPDDFPSDIYTQYWKDFVSDLYSQDTRVITTRALLPSVFSEEDMRKWWWFDGALWRLNKVTELNLAKEALTSVEFVKVQDADNYKLTQNNDKTWITVTSDMSRNSGYVLPALSGTCTATIVCRDSATTWNASVRKAGGYYGDELQVSVSPTSGTGDGTVTITHNQVSGPVSFYLDITGLGFVSTLSFIKSMSLLYATVTSSSSITSAQTTVSINLWTSEPTLVGTMAERWAEINAVEYDITWSTPSGWNTPIGSTGSPTSLTCTIPANTTGVQRQWNLFFRSYDWGFIKIVKVIQAG